MQRLPVRTAGKIVRGGYKIQSDVAHLSQSDERVRMANLTLWSLSFAGMANLTLLPLSFTRRGMSALADRVRLIQYGCFTALAPRSA